MQVSVDSILNTDGTVQTATTATTAKKSNTELSKLDFLSLLTTQLKYQDPLNPQSDTQMAAQLAQYSALETMQDIKTAITDQTEAFASVVTTIQSSALSTTNAASVSLIGKTVRLQQTSLDYEGDTVDFTVHLGNNTSAIVKLLDSSGNTVKTFDATDKDSSNSVTLSWDGSTDEEKNAADGTYTIQIENEDTDTSLYSYVEGTVNGVLYTANGPVVKVDGEEISIANILEVAGS
jgi:flagellar basal-body rod modification protein FlgD